MDGTPEPTETLMEWLHTQVCREKKMAAEFIEEASRSSADHREHCLFGNSRATIREEAFIDVMYALRNRSDA